MTSLTEQQGRLVPREDYRISTLNCGEEDFAVACMRSNLRYGKNQKKEDVKSHHYIISFDPRDGPDNGLTVDRAQELGERFCKEQFPGHQEKIPCPTWWNRERGLRNTRTKWEKKDPENGRYMWDFSVIKDLLMNPVYTGAIASQKKDYRFKIGTIGEARAAVSLAALPALTSPPPMEHRLGIGALPVCAAACGDVPVPEWMCRRAVQILHISLQMPQPYQETSAFEGHHKHRTHSRLVFYFLPDGIFSGNCEGAPLFSAK